MFFFSTGPYRSIFISHSVTIGTSVLVINSSTISLLENREKKPRGTQQSEGQPIRSPGQQQSTNLPMIVSKRPSVIIQKGGQSVSQLASQSVSQSVSQSASQSVSQSTSQPDSQSVSQSASQSVSQYFSIVVSQAANKSVSQLVMMAA